MNADWGGAALPEARLSVHARCLGFLPALVRLRSRSSAFSFLVRPARSPRSALILYFFTEGIQAFITFLPELAVAFRPDGDLTNGAGI
jgi:hypothetical protein